MRRLTALEIITCSCFSLHLLQDDGLTRGCMKVQSVSWTMWLSLTRVKKRGAPTENWRDELCPSDYDKGCEDGGQRTLNPKPNGREDPSDAQSSVRMLPTSCLIGVCNTALFLSSFLFNPSLGLEVTVMADFLISQRTFVFIQQF